MAIVLGPLGVTETTIETAAGPVGNGINNAVGTARRKGKLKLGKTGDFGGKELSLIFR